MAGNKLYGLRCIVPFRVTSRNTDDAFNGVMEWHVLSFGMLVYRATVRTTTMA